MSRSLFIWKANWCERIRISTTRRWLRFSSSRLGLVNQGSKTGERYVVVSFGRLWMFIISTTTPKTRVESKLLNYSILFHCMLCHRRYAAIFV